MVGVVGDPVVEGRHQLVRTHLPVAAAPDVPDGVAGTDHRALAGAPVDARQPQVLRLGVDDEVVGRVRQVDEAVAPAQPRPVAVEDPGPPVCLARPHPGAVVLQAPVDVVGPGHVYRHAVVLADGKVGDVQPVQASVVGDAETAVVGLHDVAGVGGVDPDHAVVAVQALRRDGEGAPPVVREGADPDDGRVPLVERARADRVGSFVFEDGDQRDAVVGGLEDAAGRRGDVEGDRIGLRDGQVDDPPAHDRRADVAGAQRVELCGGDLGVEGGGGEGGEERCGGQQE